MFSIFRWFLLFSGLLTASLAFAMYIDDQLYEGNECTLENGGKGVCKKLPECPIRLAEVREGRRTSQSSGRCGFEKFVEIVCCPMNFTEKIGYRTAEIACMQFIPDTYAIVGGLPVPYRLVDTEPSRFPYMVALGYEDIKMEGLVNTTTIRYTCGGTLISDQHVLTAAHCVRNIHGKVPIEVRLGHELLQSNSSSVQRIPIDDIVSHPRYKRSTNYNDLAILKLKEKVLFTKTVRPICLETKPLGSVNITGNTTLVVIGWGSTSLDNDGSPQLMRTPSLSLVERETCSEAYTNFPKLPHGIDDNMLCVGDLNRQADACQGDSGGPLLLLTQFKDYLVGVTSFGQSCGGSIPGVYMGIHPYLDWIEQKVWADTVSL